MSEPAVTPAPAPEPDFAAFEARENALAVGTEPTPEPTPAPEPEPEPAAEAAPDKSITPPKPDSRRTERRAQRDQDQINETIRRAVQDATEATERRLRAELAKPAETAKPEVAKADEFQPTRPRPVDVDFDNYPEFTVALAEWVADQRDAKREFEAKKTERTHAETVQREDFHTRATAWLDRRDAFLAAHPAKSDAVMAFLDTVHAGTPTGDVIMESEVGAEVADYLAHNKSEADRIRGLGPIAALRALGKLEARFDPDTTTSASATAAGPAAKTVTSAPAPPTTLASRSATPADPSAAALARGDFEAFAEAENRKALSAGR